MNDSNNFLTSKLVLTSNNLVDVINWLKLGAYVVIHNNNGRFFHKCTSQILSELAVNEYINEHRFIYVDVSKLPGLLNNGEWNYYIKEAGFDECKCSIKGQAAIFTLDRPYCDKLCLGI